MFSFSGIFLALSFFGDFILIVLQLLSLSSGQPSFCAYFWLRFTWSLQGKLCPQPSTKTLLRLSPQRKKCSRDEKLIKEHSCLYTASLFIGKKHCVHIGVANNVIWVCTSGGFEYSRVFYLELYCFSQWFCCFQITVFNKNKWKRSETVERKLMWWHQSFLGQIFLLETDHYLIRNVWSACLDINETPTSLLNEVGFDINIVIKPATTESPRLEIFHTFHSSHMTLKHTKKAWEHLPYKTGCFQLVKRSHFDVICSARE